MVDVNVGHATAAGTVPDVRATHASLGAGNGPNSHYVVAYISLVDVTLQPTDLYPPPPATASLAVRQHFATPAGSQYQGCVDNQPAAGCVDILPAGVLPTLPAVANATTDLAAYGYC